MLVATRAAGTAAPPLNRRGVSLIEVLLSMAIFLISLAAIAQLMDLGTNNALDSLNQSTGTRLALSKLAEVEAGALPVTGGSGGSFDDEPGWQFSVDSAPADVPNLYVVTVRAYRETGRKASVSLSQMVLDPTKMGTAAAAVKPTATATGAATP